MGAPPNHPDSTILVHFTIETHGDLKNPHFKNPPEFR